MEERIRRMKHALQAILDRILDVQHPSMTWLILHASNALNNYHIHRKTDRKASAQLHGREAPEALAEFGETVLYYVPAKPRRNLDACWLPGVYRGRTFNADEHYLGTASGGVVRSRSVSRVAEETRWDAGLTFGISGTPGRPREKKAYQHSREEIE